MRDGNVSKLYPSHKLKQVLIRIPDEMRNFLQDEAEKNGRSLTAEVISRLELTLPKTQPWLSKIQKAPRVLIEKRMLDLEGEFQEKIDALKEEVSSTAGTVRSLKGQVAALEEAVNKLKKEP